VAQVEVEQEVVHQDRQQQEHQVQLIQVVEAEEYGDHQQQEEMVVQVLFMLEHQDPQIFLQIQEQTQLQHYRHRLEVVKLRHSRFLEHLQLANNFCLLLSKKYYF
jgi:hypothetical protein